MQPPVERAGADRSGRRFVGGTWSPGGGTADTRDFPPNAGPPKADPPQADPPKAENSLSRIMTTLNAAIELAPELPAAYVLRACASAYLYKGACRNLRQRLQDHRAGRVSRTKKRRPLELVYCETFSSFTEARRRELFWKTGTGRAWLKQQLAAPDARVVERQTQGT